MLVPVTLGLLGAAAIAKGYVDGLGRVTYLGGATADKVPGLAQALSGVDTSKLFMGYFEFQAAKGPSKLQVVAVGKDKSTVEEAVRAYGIGWMGGKPLAPSSVEAPASKDGFPLAVFPMTVVPKAA